MILWTTLLLLSLLPTTHAAYYPQNQTSHHPPEPTTPRIAWLEYLGHLYIEVYNYGRAQQCIDEIRRLSGVNLADASLARLAIDGMARRMRGFKKAPPKENLVRKVKRKAGRVVNEMRPKQAQMHSEYMQRVMAGDSGMFPQPAMPTYSDPSLTGQYYQQGTPLRPGPAYGLEQSQAEYIRRMMNCPNCTLPLSNSNPTAIGNLYNHTGTKRPTVSLPVRTNHVYGSDQVSLKSTDAIHSLLFQARLQEANESFAKLIQNSTSTSRPVYRIELVLSLLDLDMTDPNDCVPLWESDWRLNWRDKLRIVDVYRSCRRSFHLHETLFDSLRHLRFMPQIVARIKTITGAADAMSTFSRVSSKADFYQCAACWARKRMVGGPDGDGMRRMQMVLIRAEHDGGLTPKYRRYFGELLKRSYRLDHYDPRVSLFQTVFSRDLAFSMVTGSYDGLYEYDSTQGLPSPYSSLFYSQNGPRRLGSGYKALKDPNPVPLDRQQVLLDAFADGSPEQLAMVMNEKRHQLVKEMMSNNPQVALEQMLKELERVEKAQKKQSKKEKKLEKKRRKEWEKAVEEGLIPQEQIEMQERLEQQHEELIQEKDNLLRRLRSLLTASMQREGVIQGQDLYGMSFHDFGTLPVSRHHHDKLLKKYAKAEKKLTKLLAKSKTDDERDTYKQQLAYIEQMSAAQQAMQSANEQIDVLTKEMQNRHQQPMAYE